MLSEARSTYAAAVAADVAEVEAIAAARVAVAGVEDAHRALSARAEADAAAVQSAVSVMEDARRSLAATWSVLEGLGATAGLERPPALPAPPPNPRQAALGALLDELVERSGLPAQAAVAMLMASPRPPLSAADRRRRAARDAVRAAGLRRVVAGDALPEVAAIASAEGVAAAMGLVG